MRGMYTLGSCSGSGHWPCCKVRNSKTVETARWHSIRTGHSAACSHVARKARPSRGCSASVAPSPAAAAIPDVEGIGSDPSHSRASSSSSSSISTAAATATTVEDQGPLQEPLGDETLAVSSSRLRSPDYQVVSQEPELLAMLEELRGAKVLALDCEGVKLGERQGGKLTLMQISARISQGGRSGLRIWVVDVLALRWRAFHYHTQDRQVSLKKLLEDDSVAKLMYDVRSDTAQLHAEYNIKLRAAYDLQLAEVAVRQLQMLPTTYVLPLDKVLSTYLPHTPTLVEDMQHSYDTARAYHYSNKTEVWEERPLSAPLLHYAATDVRYLHALQDALHLKLPSSIIDKVKQASMSRSQQSSPPDKRRAEAPVIVRRADIMRLLHGNNGNSGRQSPAPSGPATGAAASEQQGADSRGTAEQQAGEQAAEAAGVGRPSSRARNSKAPAGQLAAAKQPEKPIQRALPQKLAVPGEPVIHLEGGLAPVALGPRGGPPVLLQPRKRAEGEQAPTWIYDSLKPKQQAAEPEHATEHQHEQGGDGAVGAAPQEAEQVLAEAAQKPVEAAEKPGLKNGLLLWEADALGKQQQGAASSTPAGPTLQRPLLHRPVRKQA